MRKNISVTNERVLQALDESSNFSKLIELAVLHYLDTADKDYMTRLEVIELINSFMMMNQKETISTQATVSKNDLTDILNL